MGLQQRLTTLFSGLRTELVRSRGEIHEYNAINADEFSVFGYINPNENWTSPRKTGAQLRMFGTFELRRGDVPQR